MWPKAGDERGEFRLTVCVGFGEYRFELGARVFAADAECNCRRIDAIARGRARGLPGLGCCQVKCSAQARCIRALQRPQVGQEEHGWRGSHKVDISAHMENDHVAMHNTAVL